MSDQKIAELVRTFWLAGDLRGLLLEHQQPLYDLFRDNEFKKCVWLCSRRFGKSAAFCILAFETCLRKNGAKVRYGAESQKMVYEYIVPLVQTLTAVLPEEIKPIWIKSEGRLLFPSHPNSSCVISGLDEGRADRLRGPSMDLGIIDEAQGVEDLHYVVKSVLMPQTITTRGRILIGGTVPKSSYHPFVDYIHEADKEKALIKRTIYQDSRPEIIAQIPELIKESGGPESSTWLREYMVEIVSDEESAILPEFNRPEVRARCIQEFERPTHFIPYTVVDLGLIDYTAAVFGYVDFIRAKKVILDEFIVNRRDSKYITDAIFAKEKQIWGTDKDGHCLHKVRRYVDGPALTVTDLNSIHNFQCSLITGKDELDAMVNELRIDAQQARLQIHPRCTETVKQLQYGIWDNAHKKFARSSAYGHFDLLAATMYFVRYVNMRENPYPANYGAAQETHIIRNQNPDSYTRQSIRDAFNLK